MKVSGYCVLVILNDNSAVHGFYSILELCIFLTWPLQNKRENTTSRTHPQNCVINTFRAYIVRDVYIYRFWVWNRWLRDVKKKTKGLHCFHSDWIRRKPLETAGKPNLSEYTPWAASSQVSTEPAALIFIWKIKVVSTKVCKNAVLSKKSQSFLSKPCNCPKKPKKPNVFQTMEIWAEIWAGPRAP